VTTTAASHVTGFETPEPAQRPSDHRGSWIPNLHMITTRIMELRKRRGLMIALLVVNIGLPSVFLLVRLLAHAFAPKSYGPAGGYDIFTGLAAGVMYIFGFIVAATLGATAGSSDLSDGMFRHLVVTGRSRLALYFARIPAGLAIIVPMVAVGFTIVCTVCVFAAPTRLSYSGVTVPYGLSEQGFEHWAAQHSVEVLCDLPGPGIPALPCGPNPNGPNPNGPVVTGPKGEPLPGEPSPAQLRADAMRVAQHDYSDYTKDFLYPSDSLMVRTGLWIELEAAVGFFVGLGLASLIGQRTVTVILMVVLEIILTPLFSRVRIAHLINAQRAVVGVAMVHLEPSALPLPFGGGGGGGQIANHGVAVLIPESLTAAVCVVIAWIVVWTALGAWRMARRDA